MHSGKPSELLLTYWRSGGANLGGALTRIGVHGSKYHNMKEFASPRGGSEAHPDPVHIRSGAGEPCCFWEATRPGCGRLGTDGAIPVAERAVRGVPG